MIVPILLDIIIWTFLSDRKQTADAQNIQCSPSNQCQNTAINCNVDNDCSISCLTQESCSNSNIICPTNGDCIIICNQESSCQNSQITGPINGELTISCNGPKSCQYATISAPESSKLNLTGCIQSQSCQDLSIYCAMKKCIISGNDNLGPGLNIYAINGWRDIKIDKYSGSLIQDGYMFCGTNYSKSCQIASDEWQCIDNSDICYNDINVDGNNNSSKNDVGTDIIIGTNNSSQKDPKGILYVGLFLVFISLTWISCGVIRYTLKKNVMLMNDGSKEGSNDGESSSSSSFDSSTDEEYDEGDHMIEMEYMNEGRYRRKSTESKSQQQEVFNIMDDVDQFHFERVPQSALQ